MLLLALAVAGGAQPAFVTVPPFFSDHMVLQASTGYDGASPSVHGWASPGERVVVDALGGTSTTTADSAGRWNAQLSPQPAGSAGNVTVTGKSNSVVARDVLYGDVFLCSGQSNMHLLTSYALNASAEIASAGNYPFLRLLTVPCNAAMTPQEKLPGRAGGWELATPGTVKTFSAICYLTGRQLSDSVVRRGHPIGLIWASWGATQVEPWMSPRSLERCPAAAGGNGPARPANYNITNAENLCEWPHSCYCCRRRHCRCRRHCFCCN